MVCSSAQEEAGAASASTPESSFPDAADSSAAWDQSGEVGSLESEFANLGVDQGMPLQCTATECLNCLFLSVQLGLTTALHAR